ncbi:MAG: cation-transporting P-type ATPase [Candidatus Micrarchaeota archaeon]
MVPWHTLSVEDTLGQLKTSRRGLTDDEVAARIAKHGKNTINIKKQISPLKIFINQFRSLLVIILIFAAFVSLAIGFIDPGDGDFFDAILIFAIVIANAVFGFVQEYKAEKTMDALSKMSAPSATVIRNGKEKEVASEDLVPGDMVVFAEGDKVAADTRILESFSLYVDQSMLTGESVPVPRDSLPVTEKTSLSERSCMLYANSVIARGRAMGIVVETGIKTEVGKIAKQISEAPEKVTQFHIEIDDIGKKISIITVFILLLIIATEFVLRTGDIFFIFIAAVALGVAAIPEGLPAVVTLALSIATNRMLRENALMRRLSTVQDLGSIDIICTDKTGTLTENVMTVTDIYSYGVQIKVTGKGIDIAGKFVFNDGGTVNDLGMLLDCAVLCNDSRFLDGRFKGDPTEVAVLIPAYKAGINVEMLRDRFKRIDEIPFSADRKRMSTINKSGADTYSFVKGAPESIISFCTWMMKSGKEVRMGAKDREMLFEQNKGMSSRALRVLAFAYKKNPKSHSMEDAENGMVFLGLMGMQDPPREGVRKAVDDCRSAGIRVIMITGDNQYTAVAIGKELGFGTDVLTGGQLDELSEPELLKVVEKIDIYARTSPSHKVMLLKALKKNNHIVCMTGDGVNDAAALKNSDVGIAMGIRGTEVTKQASDLILLDDNFITIRNAIAQGRGSFDNVRKFVTLLLGANTSEVLAVLIASVSMLGLSPKIAIQLLWINLLTDGLPALALGVDVPATDILKRKPRPKSERILDRGSLYFIAWLGIIEALAVIGIYAYYFFADDLIKAYTMFFTAFVVMENISVYLVRWRYNTPFLSNKWLHFAIAISFLFQLVILYTDAGSWFGVVPLNLMDWAVIFGVSAVLLGIIWFAVKVIEPLVFKSGE